MGGYRASYAARRKTPEKHLGREHRRRWKCVAEVLEGKEVQNERRNERTNNGEPLYYVDPNPSSISLLRSSRLTARECVLPAPVLAGRFVVRPLSCHRSQACDSPRLSGLL